MRNRDDIEFKKLSDHIASASLDQTRGNLEKLRRLTRSGSEIKDDISHLIEDMRSVGAEENQPFLFTTVLSENKMLLEDVLRSCDDIRFREFSAGSIDALLVFIDGLTDTNVLEQMVLRPLMSADLNANAIDARTISRTLLPTASPRLRSKPADIIEDIMSGSALLILDGSAECIAIGAARYVKRAVSTGTVEGAIQGPKEAFTEILNDNIVLIRRRARDPNIKVEIVTIGDRTKTSVAIIYCSTLAKPGLVEEVKRRLAAINTDQIFLAHTIEEFIVDHPWNPFPQTQSTENPTKVAAALYEGRAAIITDNTPNALIIPCTLNTLIQTTEDYGTAPLAASLLRLTRFVSAFMAIYLPSIYIGIMSYHPGMLPTPLAISIAQLRASTPFPSIIEALIMEALIEIFQEAIVRLPDKISGSVGVVGALVIGTTIVQAGIVNPVLVVIMAMSALCSYTMSAYNLSLSLRVYRVPLILITAALGLYGLVIGAMMITINLCSMRSFGESYLGGTFNIRILSDWKDQILRLPAKLLRTRSKELGAKDLVRTRRQP
jgi:hypothetical protein